MVSIIYHNHATVSLPDRLSPRSVTLPAAATASAAALMANFTVNFSCRVAVRLQNSYAPDSVLSRLAGCTRPLGAGRFLGAAAGLTTPPLLSPTVGVM